MDALVEKVRAATRCGAQVVCVEGAAGSGKSSAVRLALGKDSFVRLDGGLEADKSLRVLLNGRTMSAVDDAERCLGKDAPARVVLTLVDMLREERMKHAVVVLIAESVQNLHPVLRTKVGEIVQVEIPSVEERGSVWKACAKKYLGVDLGEEQVEVLNCRCHGWVQSDIALACHKVSKRECGEDTFEELLVAVQGHTPFLFKNGSGSCPWQLVSAQNVETTWNSIGGLEDVKQSLREMIVWPTVYKDRFQKLGISRPSGVLLYGPPGTGKTLLASAVAKETNANFLSVSISDVVKGYVGESEKAIATVFSMARKVAPCVLFFDEFQALFGDRNQTGDVGRKLISQFLLETDRKVDGLILLASTNMPEAIDPSLLRPGRFDRKLLVPLPDATGRRKILQNIYEAGAKWATNVQLERLVDETEGFSGAEIEALCNRAALASIERNQNLISAEMFQLALTQ